MTTINNNLATANIDVSGKLGLFSWQNDYGFPGITSLTINAQTTNQGIDFESETQTLTTLKFPLLETITDDGYIYLENLTSLTSVEFPLLKTIEKNSFEINYCTNLTNINLSSLQSIPDYNEFGYRLIFYALNQSTTLFDVLNLSKTVQNLSLAVYDSNSITSIDFTSYKNLVATALENNISLTTASYANLPVLQEVNISSIDGPVSVDISGCPSISYLRIVFTDISQEMLDTILIDLDNSTTAISGSLYFQNNNGKVPSSASDEAKNDLISKGWNITIS